MDVTEIDVIDNREAGRFEVVLGEERAELRYRLDGTDLLLTHTEVPDAFEGKGVGSRLVRAALDRAGHDGLTLVPFCPFARAWLGKHPDDVAAAGVEVLAVS
jgi:predicted GNAT family acetyltransferase